MREHRQNSIWVSSTANGVWEVKKQHCTSSPICYRTDRRVALVETKSVGTGCSLEMVGTLQDQYGPFMMHPHIAACSRYHVMLHSRSTTIRSSTIVHLLHAFGYRYHYSHLSVTEFSHRFSSDNDPPSIGLGEILRRSAPPRHMAVLQASSVLLQAQRLSCDLTSSCKTLTSVTHPHTTSYSPKKRSRCKSSSPSDFFFAAPGSALHSGA